MYCGNCLRDNALVTALRRQGHDAAMVPLYLPMRLDEAPAVVSTPTFFGGINVFLSQHSRLHRRAPAWLRRWMDAPFLLRFAAGRAAKTRAADVGELNHSMLRGESGNQSRELDELVGWMNNLPRPDAVFLSNALLVGFARRIREALGTRVFVFLQSEEAFLDAIPEPWGSRSWQMLAERGRDVDGWISPSRYFADRMTRRLGLPRDRVKVVPNGINLDGYDRLHAREPRRPGDPLTIGFFARQCHDKGLDLVVDTYIELRRNGAYPNLRLRIGGGCGPTDEPFVAEQKVKLAAAGLLADASFHPNVSRDEKIAFYAACDVLSVPARPGEAFGLYVIESLAAGTPLVQPTFGTFPELLDDTGGGVLCGPHDPKAIAAALRPLLDNPSRLREMGDAGRRAVFERYTDDAMARGTIDAIGQLRT